VQPGSASWWREKLIRRAPRAIKACPPGSGVELVLRRQIQRATAAARRHWQSSAVSVFSGNALHLVLWRSPNGRSKRCGRCWLQALTQPGELRPGAPVA